jgi:uncharacterized protein
MIAGGNMETETVNAGSIIKKIRKRLIILSGIVLVIAALAVWEFYSGLVVSAYEVTSSKVQEGASVRIAVIADLHSHIYGKDQQPLLDMIKDQQPDIIALVGDIVDDAEPQVGAKLFLQDITDIAPVYYVSGNHEYWSGECESIKQMVSRYGITVLSNERKNITVNGVKLCICGIDDPEVFDYTDDEELQGAQSIEDILSRFLDLDDSTVNILLAHRPEFIDTYLFYGFDLILSGHTHGGQIRIPLISNGLFAPCQGWFPKYPGGRYDFDSQTMIVSRGIGAGNSLPRIFNPPEVVIVDIKGEKQ